MLHKLRKWWRWKKALKKILWCGCTIKVCSLFNLIVKIIFLMVEKLKLSNSKFHPLWKQRKSKHTYYSLLSTMSFSRDKRRQEIGSVLTGRTGERKQCRREKFGQRVGTSSSSQVMSSRSSLDNLHRGTCGTHKVDSPHLTL